MRCHAGRDLRDEVWLPQVGLDPRRKRIEEDGVEARLERQLRKLLARVADLEPHPSRAPRPLELRGESGVRAGDPRGDLGRPVAKREGCLEHRTLQFEAHDLEASAGTLDCRQRTSEVQPEPRADVEESHDGTLATELADPARSHVTLARLAPRPRERVARLAVAGMHERPRAVVGAEGRPHARYDARRVDEHKLAPEERAKLVLYRDRVVAASYDQRWRGGRGRARDQRKQRAIATALALLGPARTILDVPCGTGRFTQFLTAAGLEYTGGDASLAMLDEARRKHPQARFAVSDLSRLPYPDRSFDVALCIRLMHLVRDRELRARFLRELARVSRVGVIVDFRQDKALKVWLGRARAKLGLRAKPPGALALEKIHAELEAAGLEVIASIPVRKIPYLSDKIVLVAKPRG